MENKKNLKRYSIEYKCNCIAFYLDILAVNPATSYTSTSKRLNLDRRILTRWIKNKEKIFDTKNKRSCSRLRNKIDTSLCSQMELQLKKWLLELWGKDICIDGDTIKSKATEIYNEIHPFGPMPEIGNVICSRDWKEFKASSGWLYNFCNRQDFSYRRITTTGRDLPKDAIKRINDF